MTTVKQPSEVFFPFTFEYKLSEKGQRTYLLNGGDGRRTQSLKGQISLEMAEALGFKFENGGINHNHLTLTSLEIGYASTLSGFNFNDSAYDNALSFDDAQAEALRLRPLKARAMADWKALESAKEEARRSEEQARERERKAKKEAEEAENERRAELKAAQIAEWVQAHGDTNQKERFAANLFAEQEAIEAIKAHAFAPLADFPVYVPMTRAEVRETCVSKCSCNDGYENCSVDFTTNAMQQVSALEWEQMKAIQSALPGAIITVRSHEGKCEDSECDPDDGEGVLERRGFYVKLTVGGFTFNTELAIE